MCGCDLKADICGSITSGIWGIIIESNWRPVSPYPFLLGGASSIFGYSSISGFVKIGIRFFWALSTL